jgi:transcriptional regulator with XRE-family HTH domain
VTKGDGLPPFAVWLRAHRTASGLTQAQLAADIGRGRSWLSQLEIGTIRPRAEDCALLADRLHVSYSFLLRLSGEFTERELHLMTRQPVVNAEDVRRAVAGVLRELGV